MYRVLELFEVQDHQIAHAIKKLLCAGTRGAKDKQTDVKQAIDSLNRYLQMVEEDCNRTVSLDRVFIEREGA